mmetsp:Transcript_11922/g.40325  ORF Transcript_11922/g.40325 Transcript_11922/m.40325 type:complete len:274 (+) Transcript_11922:178-999(+)
MSRPTLWCHASKGVTMGRLRSIRPSYERAACAACSLSSPPSSSFSSFASANARILGASTSPASRSASLVQLHTLTVGESGDSASRTRANHPPWPSPVLVTTAREREGARASPWGPCRPSLASQRRLGGGGPEASGAGEKAPTRGRVSCHKPVPRLLRLRTTSVLDVSDGHSKFWNTPGLVVQLVISARHLACGDAPGAASACTSHRLVCALRRNADVPTGSPLPPSPSTAGTGSAVVAPSGQSLGSTSHKGWLHTGATGQDMPCSTGSSGLWR